MKICIECGEDKPLTEYYFRKDTNCYRGRCNDCRKARYRLYWQSTSVIHHKKQKEWRIKNAETLYNNKKKYAMSEAGKAVQRRGNKKFYLKNKQKWGAWQAVKNAKKSGKIIVPKECPKCLRDDLRIDAHHNKGYDREHRLDIIWLCSACHEIEHSGVNVTAGMKFS